MVSTPAPILLFLLLAHAAFAEELRLPSKSSRRKLHQQVGGVEGEPVPTDLPPLSCDFGGPHPYMVSVRDLEGDHFCGGVVVSENAVVTAAHCIDPRVSPKSSPRPELYIGGWDMDTPVEKRRTANVVIPGSWKGDVTAGSDIAILILNEPTCAAPIPFLGYKQLSEKDELVFLGYGRSSDGGTFSHLLQSGSFAYIENSKCGKSYDLDTPLTPRIMCGRSQVSGGICAGDDGGPLIYRPSNFEFKDALVGIASHTSGKCTDADGVSVLTRIQPYKWWIKNQCK